MDMFSPVPFSDDDFFFGMRRPNFPFVHPLFHDSRKISAPVLGTGVRTLDPSPRPEGGKINGFETVTNDKDSYEIQISADGFDPDDLKIELREAERRLEVSASKHNKKEFKRSYILPEPCLLDQVQSRFTKEGILRITAPKEVAAANVAPPIQSQPPRPPTRGEASNKSLMKHREAADSGIQELESLRIFNNYTCGQDRVEDTDKKFQVEIDVDGFNPGELGVELDPLGRLTVSAKHEESKNGNSVSRKFNRQYQIPTECLLDQLQSTLSQEGMLRIEAPKKQKALKNVKKVKIEVKH